jgi:hypothetical protein
MKPHIRKYKGVWVCAGAGIWAGDMDALEAYCQWFMRRLA